MEQLPSWVLSNVEGKILTIIDASVVDKQQCEAIKSLIRQEIGRLYSWATGNPPVGSGEVEKKIKK